MTKRVVIAGAGFAGITVAKELEDDCDVTLVAPTDRFVYVPLIHEVVSDSVLPSEASRLLAEVVPHARLVHARATRVEGRTLHTSTGERLDFDALVVAVGSEPNDFGVKGVHEHALTFSNLGDALRANGTLKMIASKLPRGQPLRVVTAGGPASGASRAAEDQDARSDVLRVVIVGASFTGVEVAGEIATLLDKLDVPREIDLLEARDVIFPHQNAEFQKLVKEGLAELKLHLHLKQKITEVRADGVVVEGRGHVPADVTFWCAGVKPRGVEGVDPNGRPTTQSVARDDVFVVGDAARFPKEMGVPQLAQTAEDEAKVTAWNVLYPSRPRSYEKDVRGIIVSIGKDHAVAELKNGMVLSGRIPWHVKRMLYKARIALT